MHVLPPLLPARLQPAGAGQSASAEHTEEDPVEEPLGEPPGEPPGEPLGEPGGQAGEPVAERVGLSVALLKSTVLELAILAGHLLLYPSGIAPERRRTGGSPSAHAAPGPDPAASDPALAPTRAPVPSPGRGTSSGPGGTADSGTEYGGPPVDCPDGDPTDNGTHNDTDSGTDSGTDSSADSGADACRLAQLPYTARRSRPVVLLHGFIDNRSVFVLLRRALAKDGGRHVESLNYSPFTWDIRAAAERLGRRIEEICAETGHCEVDLVGHSLGGLIARYYAQRQGGDRRIRTLVTLGTPHAGTRVVPLMNAHPVVRQMRPDSDVIAELKEPAPGCRTRFVAFWSDLDPVMVPLRTARVDHPDLLAHAVRVTGVGHLALPVHPAVATAIREALAPDAWATDPAVPEEVSVA